MFVPSFRRFTEKCNTQGQLTVKHPICFHSHFQIGPVELHVLVFFFFFFFLFLSKPWGNKYEHKHTRREDRLRCSVPIMQPLSFSFWDNTDSFYIVNSIHVQILKNKKQKALFADGAELLLLTACPRAQTGSCVCEILCVTDPRTVSWLCLPLYLYSAHCVAWADMSNWARVRLISFSFSL